MINYKRLIKNITSLYILQGINCLLPLLVFPYLVRVLGANKFGLISFAQALMMYFVMFTDYGFNLSATKKISNSKNDFAKISNICSNVLAIKLFLLISGFLLLSIITFSFTKFRQDWAIYLVSYLIVAGNAMLPLWFFQGIEQMKTIPIVSVIGRGIGTIGIFLLVKNKNDFVLAAFLQALGWSIMGGLGLRSMLSYEKVKIKIPTISELKGELRDGWHIFISTASVSLYTTTTPFLLGIFSTNTAVGYFSAGEKIVRAIQGLFFPILQSIYPQVNNLFSKSKTAAKFFLKKITTILGGLSFLISILIFIFSPYIIHFLYGHNLEPSIEVLRWISFLPFVLTLGNIFGIQTMITFGLNKSFGRTLISAGILNLIVIFPLTHLYDAKGAAIAVLITESFVAIVFAFILKRNSLFFYFQRLVTEE